MSDEENDLELRRSSRRRESSKGQSRKSALEAMKEARRSGKVHRVNVDDLVKDVYEEVDEDEYNAIVRKRQAEDFVVDDDGNGYVDHGGDFEEEEDDRCETSENSKKTKKKVPKKKGSIGSFFPVTSVAARTKVKDDAQVKLEDDDLLKNMLADLDDGQLELDAVAPVTNSLSRSNTNPFARSGTKRSAQDSDAITPRPVVKKVALTSRNQRQEKIILPKREEKRPEEKAAHVKEECVDDFPPSVEDDFDNISPPSPVELKEVETKDVKTDIPSIDTAQIALEEKSSMTEKMLAEADWDRTPTEQDTCVDVASGSEEFYTESNGQKVIRMYWLDAFEDPVKHSGTVYLFGRVIVGGGRSASCCVVVKNIQRQVFFLPRTTRFIDNVSTETPVADVEVFEEIKSTLQKKIGVGSFKCKKVCKKFMNDGTVEEGDHEKDTDVFEIRYDSASPRLPLEEKGETFSAVFNTTTTALERLLVEREMMGPGWIDISSYVESTGKQSYCEYEFSVDMERMSNITYNSNETTTPPLSRMLAINVVTTLNGKDNEVCMISTLFNPKCNLNNPSTDQKDLQRMCIVTKPSSGALPFDLNEQLASRKLSGIVQPMTNEKALLNMFLAKLQKWEPDVFVGHDLAATVDLLKARMQKLNVINWARMSRLRRSATIASIKGNKAGQWLMTAGRLLVDSRLAAMEMVRSRSYDLSELSSHLLKATRENMYANEVAAKYSSSHQLLNLIQWSWLDPWLSLRVVAHLNALPLFLQITNIVGGVTSRTLMGGRAERNEYLLMHAFAKGNIIAPNKYMPVFTKKGPSKKDSSDPADDVPREEAAVGSKNKAQYAGGLVLEPKKGLYDTLILLLDFNSLYPSIIQEYNICFTTVKHSKDSNDMPDVPLSGLAEGILPREIRGLVERRRQVKALLKAKDLSDSKRVQYDIRQMALKLTANSMYGCLGFQQSRFYAKPLAALVTSKGREILMHTKDLVERLGYSVVYGDTDSIMINTNSTDLQQAKKLGFEIKKQVNQCHRLLELDLDGIFKRMLLLKKKKYAALTVNPDDENDTKKELKGLDIVRRDWSQLAKEAGSVVVNLILDPELSREELVADIHDSLKSLRKQLDEDKVEMNMFEISKQLTRNPSEYTDLKSQPHASVAARLNETGKFTLKHGDIVEYLICEDGTTNSATQRAYHRTELTSRQDLKIDVHYYLAQQIHPVVTRLCAPIEETDAVRIAEALGMDATSYRRAAAAAHASEMGSAEDELAWQGPQNYDHCEALSFVCPKKCGETIRIRKAFEDEDGDVRPLLAACPKCSCSLVAHAKYIANQLEQQLANFVGSLLSSAFKCDDTVCEYRTLSQPLKFSREGLDCPHCSGGILRKEFSPKDLFDQQTFLRSLVDLHSAALKLKPDQKTCVENKYCAVLAMSTDLTSIVDRYLAKNSYNRVDLAFLFAPMFKF